MNHRAYVPSTGDRIAHRCIAVLLLVVALCPAAVPVSTRGSRLTLEYQ